MPAVNRFLVNTGAFTLVQALFQFLFCLLAIGQYFCVIDFLRSYPVLIYIKILYYHHPTRCGANINIGESVAELPDQAFVYLPTTPETTLRTFILTCVNLTISVFWIVGSIVLIKGGYRLHHSNHIHWPWVIVMFSVIFSDAIAIALYCNDSFSMGTLSDLLNTVGGTGSGLGNFDPSTVWAAWVMAALYSRFGVIFIINILLMVLGVVDCTRFRTSITSSEIERQNRTSMTESSKPGESDEATSSSNSANIPKIPRPGLTKSFRAMKDFLFRSTNAQPSSDDGRNRNRVNFQPEETTSDPLQNTGTFENLILEQQRRLQGATVDTSGRRSPPLVSRSLPQLNTSTLHNNLEPSGGWNKGSQQGERTIGEKENACRLTPTKRKSLLVGSDFLECTLTSSLRSTVGQLSSQRPWAYIAGAPTNRMRDQLPPDEDLPPVPLPDYTAFQSARKASVHRAASSLSSLTQVKDYSNSKSSHPGSVLVDVLY